MDGPKTAANEKEEEEENGKEKAKAKETKIAGFSFTPTLNCSEPHKSATLLVHSFS